MLLQEHLKLARNIARKFAPKNETEDYVSEAYLTVLKLGEKLHVHPEPLLYVAKSVRGNLNTYYHEDSLVRVPKRTNHVKLKTHSLGYVIDYRNSDDYFKEELEFLNGQDRQLIELRLAGYTDAEIAHEFKLSQFTIWTRRQKIANLYEELNNENS